MLGSGPIRIGQGIEFDYCSVQAAMALRRRGVEAVMVNSNPETVSTDFDCSTRLYFEPLDEEAVAHVIEAERPRGVVVQFGGQTAINLAAPLAARGVTLLGSGVDAIDAAEDRHRFEALLRTLGIPQPPGAATIDPEEAMATAERIGASATSFEKEHNAKVQTCEVYWVSRGFLGMGIWWDYLFYGDDDRLLGFRRRFVD